MDRLELFAKRMSAGYGGRNLPPLLSTVHLATDAGHGFRRQRSAAAAVRPLELET